MMSSVAGTVANQTPSPDPAKANLLESLPFSTGGVVCTVVGYAPLMLLHFWTLWSKEQYQYFPFVLLAFGYLLYTRFRDGETAAPTARSAVIGRYGYLTAWVLLALATLFQSAWLAAVSLNVLLAAVLVSLAHVRRIQNLWGIWCLLWLLVPLPLGIDTRVVVRLQQLSSVISSAILDMSNINHLMIGNILQLPDKQFFVDQACSGIVSVMAVIACGAIYAVWLNRSPIHVALLILAGVGWAISLNVARICLIAMAHAWWETDLSDGRPHEMLGFGLFTMTFIALVSTDQILDFLLRPISVRAVEDGRQKQNIMVAMWNKVTLFCDPKRDPSETSAQMRPRPVEPRQQGAKSSIAFGALGILSFVPIGFATQTTLWSVDHAQTIETDFLPERIGNLERQSFESRRRPGQHELGEFSRLFIYRDPETNTEYLVSFDFPFTGGWHELCVCYKTTGWTLIGRNAAFPDREGADHDWPVVTGEFSRDEEYGFVAFSNFNADADGLAPPTDLIFWRPWRHMRRRLLKTVSGQTFQVQVWVSGEEKISDSDKEIVNQTLLDVRERFREYFRKSSTLR